MLGTRCLAHSQNLQPQAVSDFSDSLLGSDLPQVKVFPLKFDLRKIIQKVTLPRLLNNLSFSNMVNLQVNSVQ
jgi:hypothetical protein